MTYGISIGFPSLASKSVIPDQHVNVQQENQPHLSASIPD